MFKFTGLYDVEEFLSKVNHKLIFFCCQVESLKQELSDRDNVICQLSANLKTTTESRERLQSEYADQAKVLADQICHLQEQLQQVSVCIMVHYGLPCYVFT